MENDLDPVILNAVTNQHDRLFTLKLEKDLTEFIASSRSSMEFPSLNSYQRLILHRLSDLFNLEHIVNYQETMVVTKTPFSKV